MERAGGTVAQLRARLDGAVADPRQANAAEIARLAGAAFGAFRRTDMRSGVANIIRRLADLDASGDQPIPADGWRILRNAVDLLERPNVTPTEVRDLDTRLQEVGLDVDHRPAMPPHQAGQPNPN